METLSAFQDEKIPENSASMSTSALSPNGPYLLNTGGFIGAFITLFGTSMLLRPGFAVSAWKFTPPASPKDRALVHDVFRIFAAREIYLGTAIVTAWYLGEPKVMGWLLFTGLPVAVVDGIVQKNQTGGGEWNHWGLMPVLVVLGGGLLGWFEGMM